MPPDDLPPDLQRPLDEVVVAPRLRPAAPPATGHETPPATGQAAGRVRQAGRAAYLIGQAAFRAAATPARVAGRAGHVVTAWSHRPAGRFFLPGFAMALLIGVAGTAGVLLIPAVGAADGLPPDPVAAAPIPTGAPTAPALPPPPLGGAGTPGTTPGPDAGTGVRAEALQGWADPLAARTEIPTVALQAYGYAELAVARTDPTCQLSWTTLAAIGRVESNHGRSGGATLLPDGRSDPVIVGAPLDGEDGRELITDTDGGVLDGDLIYDRAVGPMQFIPQTWRLEAADATGEGVADIHNIHDAALAAANYLCRHGRDLTTPTGWWGAVLAYNNVQSYADAVFAAANEYGQLSRA